MGLFSSQPRPSPTPNFEEKKTLEERKAIAQKLISDYPGMVPVILQPTERSIGSDGKQIRLCTPKDSQVSALIGQLRSKATEAQRNLSPFLALRGARKSVNYSQTIGEIYERHASDDGHLYLLYEYMVYD